MFTRRGALDRAGAGVHVFRRSHLHWGKTSPRVVEKKGGRRPFSASSFPFSLGANISAKMRVVNSFSSFLERFMSSSNWCWVRVGVRAMGFQVEFVGSPRTRLHDSRKLYCWCSAGCSFHGLGSAELRRRAEDQFSAARRASGGAVWTFSVTGLEGVGSHGFGAEEIPRSVSWSKLLFQEVIEKSLPASSK